MRQSGVRPEHQLKKSVSTSVKEAVLVRHNPVQYLVLIFNRDHHGATSAQFSFEGFSLMSGSTSVGSAASPSCLTSSTWFGLSSVPAKKDWCGNIVSSAVPTNLGGTQSQSSTSCSEEAAVPRDGCLPFLMDPRAAPVLG